ncbi:adenylate-forming enzyme AfeA [Apiospora hydei]|uniref:Adenylate-forming enzyme AfeA n=1 Tax=Apiospora hydei TaxID=1337664 RepID=A0ABR1UYR2_9PEZI
MPRFNFENYVCNHGRYGVTEKIHDFAHGTHAEQVPATRPGAARRHGNSQVLRSEWYPTLDLVLIEGGKTYVLARNKELLKANGDCAIMGVMSDDGTTEVPRAYVMRKEGLLLLSKKPVSGDDVYNVVAGYLATYKLLKRGVVLFDAISRTADSKTQCFGLVQAKAGDDTAKAMGRPSPLAWM